MNNCMFTGRFTRDVEVKYSTGENATAIARFTLAVPRKFKREGEPEADFPSFVAFGKSAESIGRYFHKGKPIVIEKSHVQTGSYTNKDGVKVYTTDFIVDEWAFVDKDGDSNENGGGNAPTQRGSGNGGNRNRGSEDFMNMPDTDDEAMPWDQQ